MLKLGLTDLKEDKFKGYPTEELFAILTLAIIGDAYVNHKDNKGKKTGCGHDCSPFWSLNVFPESF